MVSDLEVWLAELPPGQSTVALGRPGRGTPLAVLGSGPSVHSLPFLSPSRRDIRSG